MAKRDSGVLLSFYVDRQDAVEAVLQLRRKGFRRAALVHKAARGDVKVDDAIPRYCTVGGAAGGLVIGALACFVSLKLGGIDEGLVAYLALALAGVVGAMVGWLIVRSVDHGVDDDVVAKYARWLVADETAVIVQAPADRMGRALALLRTVGTTEPSVFAFHPVRMQRGHAASERGEPLTTAQLAARARHLAGRHTAEVTPRRGEPVLRRLDQCERAIGEIRQELADAVGLEQRISVSAEWILDNAHIVQAQIDDVRLNLPKKFYHELPLLTAGSNEGQPRVYAIAADLVASTDGQLDRHTVNEYVASYQSAASMTIGELWALPLMLRIALIERLSRLAERVDRRLREREEAEFWANRLRAAARRDPNQLFSLLAELARQQADPSSYFAFQLTEHLYDEEVALVPVQSWLERKLASGLTDIVLNEQTDQAAQHVSIGNVITSLRLLTLLDWREVFETQSVVERTLAADPAEVYRRMDFETRDVYRKAVEEIARNGGLPEYRVSQAAVDLARERARDRDDDLRRRHVGCYLIDDGRRALLERLHCREARRYRVRSWVYRHHTALYVGSIALATVMMVAAIAGLSASVAGEGGALLVGLLSVLPASQLAVHLVNYWVTRALPPRLLPKMSFERGGVPDEFRTLVVVPMLLVDAESIIEEIEKLEIRYLANPGANILFSLFSDFADAREKECPGDGELLAQAVAGIEALNERYGANRFFLFHRERVWTESEQRFLGWERKRGKLEALNQLINGEAEPDCIHVGEPELLTTIRFVITLDSDTQLPRDTARRLIETMAHPLNRWCDDPGGRRGYSIVQPRVSATLPSATATRFSRLFTDPVGVDPYTKAVSDVYQDLAGEGSYVGKGIYDPRAFHRTLTGRFPEQRLLSHDLIEGAHLKVGFASDIELFDDFPPDYVTYANREHRWIRGDWQIADWATPRVPGPAGRRVPNPLSGINRWKIFDNLRRSMVPSAAVFFLGAGWIVSPVTGSIASCLVGVLMLFPPLAELLTWVTSPPGSTTRSWREVGHALVRSVVETVFLPYRAGLSLDAILRVWYRRLVSRRRLLEWTTARMAEQKAAGRVRAFLVRLGLAGSVAVVIAVVVWVHQRPSLCAAGPFLFLWLISPYIGLRLSRREEAKREIEFLSPADAALLRRCARQTWSYFADFVNEASAYLPPDNYQVSYGRGLAQRTSPTNIGLWLLSALGAHDFGYETCDGVLGRLRQTFETIDKLERYNGHLLNWYSLPALRPLEPRYVSTVDSGNLLACLWTLEGGIRELLDAPVLGEPAFQGLDDTFHILRDVLSVAARSDAHDAELEELGGLLGDPPEGLDERIHRLRKIAGKADALATSVQQGGAGGTEAAYWAGELVRQAGAWVTLIDRYLSWLPLLAEKPEALGDRVMVACPSLRALADGDVPALGDLVPDRNQGDGAPDDDWLGRLNESFSTARWLAGEVLADAQHVIGRARRLAEGMNMRFLYDARQRLFSVGFNVREQRRDTSYYDLLASEARLGSFVAIARGDVPARHWLAMARPYGSVGRRRVLLSWGGTMFEYLMPVLLQRVYDNSLLDRACSEAVAVHREYARRRRVPWGMSEAAYSDLDADKSYQYQAFGVPGLGLKRGLENELVVAPYATLLALAVAPVEAVENLRRLHDLGLSGRHGFYESIDFSRQRRREGERGVVVHAYMAHHQAMGFLAVDNLLSDGAFRRRLHADPRIRATEPLLYERIPVSPPLYQVPARERGPARIVPEEIAPSVSTFDTPHTRTPRTQLLSNGRYAVMVTNAGGGYSRWGDVELTRWRADTTCDRWGTFCYVRDTESGRFWSNAYQPAGGDPDNYAVSFTVDRAEIRRSDDGIETETEIMVATEDDAEIRRIAFINRSGRPRALEVTSYVELALAPHAADRQHPAFSKLFIETEAIEPYGVLLATRRPRDPEDQPVWVAHVLTAPDGGDLEFETNRGRFIGRGRTCADPAAVHGALSNSFGQVLDPILSLRRRISLEPGERVELALVLAAGATREDVIALVERYSDPQAVARGLDMAWSHAQLELRHLRIQPDDARRFQQLANAMLYPHGQFRPSADRLKQNRLGQARLWPYGISGDLPIAVVTIGDARDMTLVRQMLQAHTYWRLHGLKADLVMLNEESSSYDQPLNEQLKRLAQGHSMYTGVDTQGGVFLRNVDQIPEDDLTLLLSAARVVLVAARGPLAQQLGMPMEVVPMPGTLPTRYVEEEPSAPLVFMELPYFNGLGGFTADGREYAVYLGPDRWTPAPWVNVIANPTFGTLVTEARSGFTWFGNSQHGRLTGWSNDPVCDTPSEAVYIRDEETGTYWSPTPLPIRELDAYRSRHGAGYTVFEHNSHAIEQELITFVPTDETGGDPVCIKRLRLRNDSSRLRRLSVTFYAEWTLGTDREKTAMHVVTSWDARSRSLLAVNRYHPDDGERVAFAALTPPPHSTSGDRTEFIGRNRTAANPAALQRVWLSGRTGAGLDPCAALQIKLDLAPGQDEEVAFLLGQAGSVKEVRELVKKYRDAAAIDAALHRTSGWWDRILGTVQVETPHVSVNVLLNRWLLYQTLSCRVWGRSGFYQSGGAYGFRDQLQDVMALLTAAPAIAREHIMRAAGRQFPEGDVQHWWHPPGGGGVRTRCSDDMLWLPYAVSQYVDVTGDTSILQIEVPFVDGRELEAGEYEAYLVPNVTDERVSIYEHCRLAIARGLTRGPHGLPLIGNGDWNDGMNRVGVEGRGESVWLGWFLVDVLKRFARVAKLAGRAKEAASYRASARELAKRVERSAWDGEWYCRAYLDDGTPIGSSANQEARIDSLPQSWAAICGGADPERTRQALDAAWKHLVLREEKLVLLFTPPFDTSAVNPGYIKGYPPGVRENGGQYTHAAVWFARALAEFGDGDRAGTVLRLLNPVEHAREPEEVERYVVEPYALAADIYRLPGHVGRGGWTWYTGSAGWLYRVWIESVLGVKIRGSTLSIDPVLPPGWDRVGIKLKRGKALYEITVENPEGASRGVAWVEMDGRRLPKREIPLEEVLIKHRVRVRMGTGGEQVPSDAP